MSVLRLDWLCHDVPRFILRSAMSTVSSTLSKYHALKVESLTSAQNIATHTVCRDEVHLQDFLWS